MHAVSLAWLLAAATMPAGAEAADEQVLQAAHLVTTGPKLLDYFRKRLPPGPDPAAVAALIKRLGAPESAVRDQAAGSLLCYGPYAIAPLRQAVNAIEDVERAARARACLEHLEG